jgi:hypothetical protein
MAVRKEGFEGPVFEKTLLDVERGVYVEHWSLSGEVFGFKGEKAWTIQKRRLRGGLQEGVDIVRLNNGSLSITVVPTRGMGIWKGSFKGNLLGWESPIKVPVHPHFINLDERGGLGWLRGFNEWVVRCGLESNGAPGEDIITDNMGRRKSIMLPLHGRIANIPASELKAFVRLGKPLEIGLYGSVWEASMFGQNLRLSTYITTEPQANWVRIHDIIENLGGTRAEMQLLYHCNYGRPFLEEGARLLLPIKRVAPRDARASEGMDSFLSFQKPEPGFVEQVYFFELLAGADGWTKVVLEDKDRKKAVSISFNLERLPCFTLWKNTASLEEGYVTGLEPATNFPNQKAFERSKGRVLSLGPRERFEAELILAAHIGEAEVLRLEEDVRKIQGLIEPKVFDSPIPEFSPLG